MNPAICSISFDAVPSAKGAARHITAFSEALCSLGHGLDLVTLPAPADFPQQSLTADGLVHHHMHAQGPNVIERVLDFRTRLGLWWGQRQPTVAHVRSIWEGYPLATRKGTACKQLVYEVNGLPSIELKYHYPKVAEDDALLDKLRHQEQVCLNAADLVVTVSQVNADYLISRGISANKIEIIPNGVHLADFPSAGADCMPALRGERPLRLLYMGTLSHWQGVHVAIEALALLRRDYPATLTVVGPGRSYQRKQLQRLADKCDVMDAFTFEHPVAPDAVAAVHHQHDVALAPLLANDRNCVQGCSPLKVLEAMACGSVMVASELPVVRELATENEMLFAKPGSAKSLKDALLALYRDPERCVHLQMAARQRAEMYGWDRAQQHLCAAYQQHLQL